MHMGGGTSVLPALLVLMTVHVIILTFQGDRRAGVHTLFFRTTNPFVSFIRLSGVE